MQNGTAQNDNLINVMQPELTNLHPPRGLSSNQKSVGPG